MSAITPLLEQIKEERKKMQRKLPPETVEMKAPPMKVVKMKMPVGKKAVLPVAVRNG